MKNPSNRLKFETIYISGAKLAKKLAIKQIPGFRV
jgi:hypothetical protein